MNIKELEKKLKKEHYLSTAMSDGNWVSYVKESKSNINWNHQPFIYGIMHDKDGYSYFFTNERGNVILKEKSKSENEACEKLYEVLRSDRELSKIRMGEEIKKYLKAHYNFSDTRAKSSSLKLLRYYLIGREFYVTITKGFFPIYNPLKVEGYTAQELYDNYDLSVLGAYNYLIYLKEYPKEALHDLKMGLPRR